MTFKKMRVSNFKSIKDLEIRFGKFNVLVGANASGKSNFVSIFRFFRDIFDYDLENAISMQGGIEYFRNISLGKTKDTTLDVLLEGQAMQPTGPKNSLKIKEINYSLTLNYSYGLKIYEVVKLQCEYFEIVTQGKKEKELNVGSGEIQVFNQNRAVSYSVVPSEGQFLDKKGIESVLFPFSKKRRLPKNVLSISAFWFLFRLFKEIFGEISLYDFDAKLPKKATPMTGAIELEEDGNNLALVLRKVIRNKQSKEQFLNLIQEILPFVGAVKVSKFADKSFLFGLQESYHGNRFLPASLISDGTITITAIILALYFEGKLSFVTKEEAITIIEEPERNIHPFLISRIVDMMKDVSEEKQIIITTHNPEIVKYTGIENLRFIFRDDKGFTGVSEPVDNEDVQRFLTQELGIDYIYKKDLWRPSDVS
jgi:predicted ATPase